MSTTSWTSGKALYLGITNSIGHKFGTCYALGRRPRSCGQFGIKQSQLMSEGLASLQSPFLSNASFASLVHASWLSIDYGIVFKHGEHEDGPLLLFMNCVG